MLYSVVIPKEKVVRTELKVRDLCVNDNKFWSINDGDFFIHACGKSPILLDEIGLVQSPNPSNYFCFTGNQMKDIFNYYAKRGELQSVTFKDEHSEKFKTHHFKKKYQLVNTLLEGSIPSLTSNANLIQNGITGKVTNLVITRGSIEIHLCPGNMISVAGILPDKEETETLILTLYQEIFELLCLPFSISPVALISK